MIDIERIKREIPIETLIAQSGLTVIGRGHTLTTAEHDSLKVFTNNNSWAWYSQSGRDGKALGGSTIDWYMYAHRCGVVEAVKALSAMLNGGALPPMPKPRVDHKEAPAAWQSPGWQTEARRKLEAAQDRLWNKPEGDPGRAYLTERGIRQDMMMAFDLGYGDAWNNKAGRAMPALWVPWRREKITAIQYRFIGVAKDDPGMDRFGQLRGGARLLFGLQHFMDAEPGQLQTLFMVEGEFNAISLFQSVYGQYAADVVSFGSNRNLLNAGAAPMAAKVAQRYRHVIVWADEPEDALKALGVIPNALPVRSPVIDGKPHDANDLLRAGLLDDVILGLLQRVKSPVVA